MTPTIRALIVDDEKDARNGMEKLLQQCRQAVEVVAKAENAQNALEIIIDAKPDIVFLDIQMPVNSGFWLAEQLRKYHLPITLVFVTAFDEYAIQAVKFAAFDFLLKPVDVEILESTLQRFVESGRNSEFREKLEQLQMFLNQDRIGVTTENGFVFLALDHIIFCKCTEGFSRLYLTNGRSEHANLPLFNLEKKLSNSVFIKINDSVIINTVFVESVDKRSKSVIVTDVLQKFEFKASAEGLKKLLNHPLVQ